MFIGINEESQEMLFGTKVGITKGKTVKRKADAGERWKVQGNSGDPWEPTLGRDGMEIKSRV